MDYFLAVVLFFWGVFLLLVPRVIGRWYLSEDAKDMKMLRHSAIAVNAIVFALFAFPWGPVSLFASFFPDVFLLYFLILAVLFVLLSNKPRLFRVGAWLQVAASVVVFGVLLRRLPNMFMLDAGSVAPIVAVFLLLFSNVILLLLWHQSQPRNKRFQNLFGNGRTAIGLCTFLLSALLYWYIAYRMGT